MKLSQTGPEIDEAGQLISRVVAESADIEFLRQEGYRIAEGLDVRDTLWVEGPTPSRRLRMEISQNTFLGIDA